MGAEIGLLSSMTQIQNLSQSQHKPQPLPNPSSFSSSFFSSSFWSMWNPRDPQEDDDSWEVRAFAQDTTSLMGTTWPPRSYTCTFCRREFRSAQALGGHMNIHRRDRARLHHHPPPTPPPPPPPPPSNLIANNGGGGGGGGGLCLLYHLPSGTSTTSAAATLNACGESISKSVSSPSRLLSIMPYPPNNFDFRVERHGFMNSSSYCDSSSKVLENPTTSGSYAHNGHQEELDLELRLGNRPTPT